MRIAPAVTLNPEQRAALERRARSRSLPARVVERARIVLCAAAGQADKDIAHALGITPKKVSRWRRRFLTLGELFGAVLGSHAMPMAKAPRPRL